MLKSLFLSLYLLLLPLFFFLHLFHLADVRLWPNILASILIYAVPLLFFASLLVWRRGRTSAHLPLIQVLVLAGLSLQIYMAFQTQQFPALLSSLVFVTAWELYLYWYSSLGRYRGIIELGKKLPQFHLTNQQGVRQSFVAGDGKPHLLFFIRGNWCPLCVAQIGEVKMHLDLMERQGVVVDVITAQSQAHNLELQKRFQFPVRMWHDEKGDAARLLGLYHRWGVPFLVQLTGHNPNSMIPAVIILDREGKVRWFDVAENYRVRPLVSDYAQLLAAMN